MTNVVLAVANTFLQYAKRDNISVTPMKLQKLIYILYKTYLQKYKSRRDKRVKHFRIDARDKRSF